MDLSLLLDAYLGAQIAVLPFEVPILVLVWILRREMRQRMTPMLTILPADLTEEEKRALAWDVRRFVANSVRAFRESKPPQEWVRPKN